MTLEATLGELNVQLYRLREALVNLHTTSVEDKPIHDDVVLVEIVGNATEDLLGWLDGAIAALADAHRYHNYGGTLRRSWQALGQCQICYNRLHQRFATDLAGYQRLTELIRCGRQRGGEWRAWAASVKAAIEECQSLIFALNETLCDCWQTLAERSEINPIPVQIGGMQVSGSSNQ
ncbi:MAG: hypothetical protein ACOYNY_04140 [Caldilineaceae bacterium]